jgi:protein required for attachment to host cells
MDSEEKTDNFMAVADTDRTVNFKPSPDKATFDLETDRFIEISNDGKMTSA